MWQRGDEQILVYKKCQNELECEEDAFDFVTSLIFQLGVFAGGMSSFIDDGSSKDNKVLLES